MSNAIEAARRIVAWADNPDAAMFYEHISEAETIALARTLLAMLPGEDVREVIVRWKQVEQAKRDGSLISVLDRLYPLEEKNTVYHDQQKMLDAYITALAASEGEL